MKKIEEIVHPLLRTSRNSFAELYKNDPIIIYDIPLLFEKNQEKNFDAIVLVTASETTQQTRVLRRKNMTEKDYKLIKRNQLTEKEKLQRTDFIINTDKPLSETQRDVVDLYQKLKDVTLK